MGEPWGLSEPTSIYSGLCMKARKSNIVICDSKVQEWLFVPHNITKDIWKVFKQK
jgi:hypothetical protein